MSVGDLDVPGNQITVEATFMRTAPYSGGPLWAGDLVSKHNNPPDVNYLLRPNNAEITTTNGYFRTPDICEIELNKIYHAAMVYDGTTLKFYRNGFLMSSVAASGNMFQNNFQTRIGLYDALVHNTNLIGYINEVRIWNVARTQAQLRAFMNLSIPSPNAQPGLLAYYTFDNLLNKQGNPAWNGSLGGAASIAATIPVCQFVADSCAQMPEIVIIPEFDIPDTVCVNTPVMIANNTVGATSYYWNFCVANINQSPTATNLGNPNSLLSQPVFMDYFLYNNNYYGYVINHFPGKLVRLDYGNSLLNTPTAIDLGNFGGIIPPGYGAEGIQVVQNEGKWYAIIVGGYTPSGSTPRVLKIEFGADPLNLTPVATNWGNIGNMLQPLDLHVFKENGRWYGLTINAENNSVTRFDFTASFNNTPTAVNLGTFGLLDYPTGIYAVNDNGYWRVFVTNDRSASRLVRLDFGSSLLNTPTAVNLGSIGNANGMRDLTIIKYCDEVMGFAVNASTNSLYRLDFPSLSGTPVVTNMGNTGGLSTPHSISRLFRVEQDLYGFITNVGSNTITRIQFSGCSNSSFASSSLQNPPPVSYNAPGTYNINLTIDDGLPTQNSRCKKVVVMDLPHLPVKNYSICQGDSIKLGASIKSNSYSWSSGSAQDSLIVKTTGIYWVDVAKYGCVNRDSFNVTVVPLPSVNVGNDTTLCKVVNLSLNATAGGDSYIWNNGSSSATTIVNSPGTYNVIMTVNGCRAYDTMTVSLFPVPLIQTNNDTTICNSQSAQLFATGGVSYAWSPIGSLSDPQAANPVASPVTNTRYYVDVTDVNGCHRLDSVDIAVRPLPLFTISGPGSICDKESLTLSASGGSQFAWLPTDGLSNPSISNPTAAPLVTTNYSVTITETVCNISQTLSTLVTVLPLPVVRASRSNDLDCSNDQSRLSATGANSYSWIPAATLDNPFIANPVATPVQTTQYVVIGEGANGCFNSDTVVVKVSDDNKGNYLMPNAFSPNNDGINDCYGIKYWGIIQGLEFSIFNRWGERVFFTKNPQACWDGTFKGKMQDAGVFVYMVKAKSFCDQSVFRKGTFVLVR